MWLSRNGEIGVTVEGLKLRPLWLNPVFISSNVHRRFGEKNGCRDSSVIRGTVVYLVLLVYCEMHIKHENEMKYSTSNSSVACVHSEL